MHSESITRQPGRFAVAEVLSPRQTDLQLIFGHGWGQSSAAFLPIAEALKPFAASYLVDFPGFGQSPNPPQNWGTADYADSVADWLATLERRRYIWIGHSFGGRIGLQLASRHPDLTTGMVLIAAAGLQRRRTLMQRARVAFRKTFFNAGAVRQHEDLTSRFHAAGVR